MLFVAPERGEPFWSDSAKAGFIGVGAFIAQDEVQPFTIGAIYRAMTQGDMREFYKFQLERTDLNLSVACRSALNDFTNGADNTFAGIVQTITSKLSLWLNPDVDAATSASDFDLRELSLVEPLRTLRMLQYAAWLARRWDDPAFPRAFPWFNTQAYWERHVLELREQFSLLSEPMWAADLLH